MLICTYLAKGWLVVQPGTPFTVATCTNFKVKGTIDPTNKITMHMSKHIRKYIHVFTHTRKRCLLTYIYSDTYHQEFIIDTVYINSSRFPGSEFHDHYKI